MSKKVTAKEIIDFHIEVAPIVEKATLTGDYKIGNKLSKQSIKMFKILEQDIELAKTVLSVLLKEESFETQITAATYAVALNIFVDEAVTILKKIESNAEAKVYRLNAEMALKEWEKGSLVIYQKKDKK